MAVKIHPVRSAFDAVVSAALTFGGSQGVAGATPIGRGTESLRRPCRPAPRLAG